MVKLRLKLTGKMQQRIHQKMYHRLNVILIWESYKESTEHQSKYYRTYIVFHCSSFRSLFFQAISAMFLFLCYLLRADKTSSFAAVNLSFKVHWARNDDKKNALICFPLIARVREAGLQVWGILSWTVASNRTSVPF